jgi:hypothetical protein
MFAVRIADGLPRSANGRSRFAVDIKKTAFSWSKFTCLPLGVVMDADSIDFNGISRVDFSHKRSAGVALNTTDGGLIGVGITPEELCDRFKADSNRVKKLWAELTVEKEKAAAAK